MRFIAALLVLAQVMASAQRMALVARHERIRQLLA